MKRSWPIYIITLVCVIVLLALVIWVRTQIYELDTDETEADSVAAAVSILLAMLIGVHCVAMFAAKPSWRRRRLYVTRLPWTLAQALLLLIVLFIGPEFTALIVTDVAKGIRGAATHDSRSAVVATDDSIEWPSDENEAGTNEGADEQRSVLETASPFVVLLVAAGILLVAAAVMRSQGRNLWRGLGFGSRRLWRNIGIGVVAYFAFTWALLPMLDTAIRLVFDVFGWEIVEHTGVTEYRETTSVFGRIAIIVAIGLTAPFFEEVIFRGVLFQTIKRYTGSALAIGASALVFAALHPGGYVATNIFFLGLLFGYLFDLTGSIVPGIVLHFLFNGVSLLMLTAFS
jgi:membrane protease YdiL (CAAX protease family)